jgi:hypothetical protein
VNEHDSRAEIFDVFLCHNSVDKPAVREIALKLSKQGIKPWMDVDQIQPGTTWQTALGQQIESINSAAVFVGDAGLGLWQNQESQAFLNQFVKRGCPVIPVVLPSAKTAPDLPWMFANLHCIDFRTDSQPLERLIWGITGQKPAELANVSASNKPPTMQEGAPRLIAGGNEETRSDEVTSEARLFPPIAKPPDPDNATQLNILRRRVKEYWIDGVLEHSLHNQVLISLGKRKIDRAIDAPWKYTVEVPGTTNSATLDDRDVRAIYDATGSLLILGEPGAGKTTTLLDLARTLLDRAGYDIKERVPVVVDLSSWKKKQPIEEWISGELSEKYRVPRKIALFWLQHHYLLPLLDGLDEVEISMQPECVTAINAFVEEIQPSGLVVCCRLNEYRWLPKRLKLNGAICIEPLGSEEVSRYLESSGSKLVALREAIDADTVLHELAQAPLMLSIMSLAYQGAIGNKLVTQKGYSLDARRKQIFGLYVDQMFQRKGTTSGFFRKEKVIGCLSWLAREMREHSQSVFLVEGLQPNWLNTRSKRVAYGSVAILLFVLIGGILVGVLGALLLIGQLPGGLIAELIDVVMAGLNGLLHVLILVVVFALVGALVFALEGGLGARSLNQIILVESISWSWNQFWSYGIKWMIGPILWLLFEVSCRPGRKINNWLTARGWADGLVNELTCILIFGLSFGFFAGLRGRVKIDKSYPNQGIMLSLRSSLVVTFVVSLSLGSIVGLIAGLSGGLIVSLIFGSLFGLERGGSAVIKHYALRLILWLSGSTPFKFIKFLDHCAKLIFLKKVGGGYIFIHRMLLDYFAELNPPSKKAKEG